jgi:hypothetical protein
MLEPQAGTSLMSLPAEIRAMIFASMLEKDHETRMNTSKKVNHPRRPVIDRRHNTRVFNGAITTLLLSKQVLKEAAPILYGNNHFRFFDFGDVKIFLDRIGSMRRYLRHIYIDDNGYRRNRANSIFWSLRDATDLRTLSLHHANICLEYGSRRRYDWRTSIEHFAIQGSGMLAHLKRSYEESGCELSVLDVLRVEFKRCETCVSGFNDTACRYIIDRPWPLWSGCKLPCSKLAKHCLETEIKLRKRFAERLKITYDPPEEKEEDDEEEEAKLLSSEASG